ncbi:hypothetical protein HHX47_DHR9000471 [Lentinula edodes]|nr:hypothetical protein HHX47_DHR9000471 [Lentinula edodes]
MLALAQGLTYLRTWLSRSRSYPLDILLDFRDEEWDWEEEDHLFTHDAAKEIISVILPHSKRWRHIEFFTDTWAPIHAFLDLTRDIDDLPVLKSVALSRCNAYFARKGECFKPVELKEPITLFTGGRLPALRDLALVGVHVDWRQSVMVNLLELELKFHAYDVLPTLGEFTNILISCPELERLSIVGWGPRLDATFTDTRRVISMAKLTRLIFGFVDVEYAVMLLSLFHLPSLYELDLEDVAAIVDPIGSSDASTLLTLLEVSSTELDAETCFFPLQQVDYLGLRSIRSSEAVFTQFLRRFSSLEKINLSDADSALLTALGPQQFSPEPKAGISSKLRDRMEDRNEGKLVQQVKPLLQQAEQIMNKIQGMIKGADLENKIFQQAQNDQKAHRANPEEQRLAEASKVMIEEVGGTIAWARNKLDAFPKAKKDLAGVGMLLIGVLNLLGSLLSGLGLDSLLKGIFAATGLDKIYQGLGLGKLYG